MNLILENPKKQYSSPEIHVIELDNSISLALESNPPTLDNEPTSSNLEFHKADPYNV